MPTAIWLPEAGQQAAGPDRDQVLPDWALDKIRTEFTQDRGPGPCSGPDHAPAPLLRISIHDTAPGMDARTPCTTYPEPDTPDGPISATSTAPVLVAELHPNALPTPEPTPDTGCTKTPGTGEDDWPGFFHRAHHLLPNDGLLLLATRQHREAGVLTDPLGTLIACARTAGFRYLQHIVIAHAHAVGDKLMPSPPADAAPGVIHSDLIVLSAIHHG
ncbi:hypothetical protein ACQB60_10080 [Actinomycetota bacterium Odt1-20B]